MWRQRAQHKAIQQATPQQAPSATPSSIASPAGSLLPAAPLADLPLLEHGVLISALLLNPTHELVRKQAVTLLKQLCLGTPHMTIKLVMRLAKLLPDASAAGSNFELGFSVQYFSFEVPGLEHEQMPVVKSGLCEGVNLTQTSC